VAYRSLAQQFNADETSSFGVGNRAEQANVIARGHQGIIGLDPLPAKPPSRAALAQANAQSGDAVALPVNLAVQDKPALFARDNSPKMIRLMVPTGPEG
jgi:hypothetical protein